MYYVIESGVLKMSPGDYLEHHGVKGQKWGVRNYQNKDGSLTDAGRKHYGYGDGVKQFAKKASNSAGVRVFKKVASVGYSVGKKAAGKVHESIEESKKKRYEEKKEKASQSRESVLKNKKMFTNKELEELEERFKVEDEMKFAGLRRSQEISRAIATYADTGKKIFDMAQSGGLAVQKISLGVKFAAEAAEKAHQTKVASQTWDDEVKAARRNRSDYDPSKEKKPNKESDKKESEPDNTNGDNGGTNGQAKSNGDNGGTNGQAKSNGDNGGTNGNRKVSLIKDLINKAGAAYNKRKEGKLEEDDSAIKEHVAKDPKKVESDRRLIENLNRARDLNNKILKNQERLDQLKDEYQNASSDLHKETVLAEMETVKSDIKSLSTEVKDLEKNKIRHSDYLIQDGVLYLSHYGTKGQKHGTRRYRNYDGTLTEEGKKRYANGRISDAITGFGNDVNDLQDDLVNSVNGIKNEYVNGLNKITNDVKNTPETIRQKIKEFIRQKSKELSADLERRFNEFGKEYVAYMDEHIFRAAAHGDIYFVEDGCLEITPCLYHHGIEGQKWGVRRYQNYDGTRTVAGKRRYYIADVSVNGKTYGSTGSTKKQARGEAAANALLKEEANLSKKQIKALRKDVEKATKEKDRIRKEIAKELNSYYQDDEVLALYENEKAAEINRANRAKAEDYFRKANAGDFETERNIKRGAIIAASIGGLGAGVGLGLVGGPIAALSGGAIVAALVAGGADDKIKKRRDAILKESPNGLSALDQEKYMRQLADVDRARYIERVNNTKNEIRSTAKNAANSVKKTLNDADDATNGALKTTANNAANSVKKTLNDVNDSTKNFANSTSRPRSSKSIEELINSKAYSTKDIAELKGVSESQVKAVREKEARRLGLDKINDPSRKAYVDRALDKARKNDVFDIDFMEIAPEQATRDELLREYSYYLNNPIKYMTHSDCLIQDGVLYMLPASRASLVRGFRNKGSKR